MRRLSLGSRKKYLLPPATLSMIALSSAEGASGVSAIFYCFF
jgi:hypothetical protein